MMYKKLVLFRQYISGNMWPWWVFTQIRPGYTNYCKTLFSLMCGEHGLNTDRILHVSGIYETNQKYVNCAIYI